MAVAFKTPRKKNFLDLEVSMIVDEISTNKDKYLGKFSPFVTKESKAQAWDQLAIKINSVCGQSRTGKDIEKKWYNLQSTAVREVGLYSRELQKTGGGDHPKPPSETAVKIVDNIVTPDKVIGIQGGCDSMASETVSCSESEKCAVAEEICPSIPEEKPDEAATTQNLLVKLQGFNRTKSKAVRRKENPAGEDRLSGLIEIERKKLKTEEERDLDSELTALKIKKLKLELDIIQKSRDIDMKLKEKELEYKEALICQANLKSKLLEIDIASRESITYVVENPTGLTDILTG